jgi:type IV secretory pathway VirJ component
MGNLTGTGGTPSEKRPPSTRQLTQLRSLVATMEESARAVHVLAADLLPATDQLVVTLGQVREAAAKARVLAARR